jgi:hypothetical protein
MHFDPDFFGGRQANRQASERPNRRECVRATLSRLSLSALPGSFGVLADTDQCRLDLRVSVHRASEVLSRDVVLPEIRVGQRDHKVVVWCGDVCGRDSWVFKKVNRLRGIITYRHRMLRPR